MLLFQKDSTEMSEFMSHCLLFYQDCFLGQGTLLCSMKKYFTFVP